jgi:hypothetical protein
MMVKQTLKELKYALYVTIHPFKGFWDIKHEGEGSFRTGMVILALALLVSIGSSFFTEYLFNPHKNNTNNILMTLAVGIGLFVGFCVANWSFTCLSDGEGTLKEICMVTAYALVPYVLIQAIMIPLSHLLVSREASLFYLLASLGYFWTGALVVFGILVIHQYTLGKTIVVCIATLVGMGVMMYIGILFLNLILELTAFFTVLFDELRFVLS